MTYNEANVLVNGGEERMVYGVNEGYLNFWLSVAIGEYYPGCVDGVNEFIVDGSLDYDYQRYDSTYWNSLRPVIEISKSKVTAVTE